MTEQQIMKEMLYKGIHSITVQNYKGDRPTTYRAKAHVPFSDDGDNLAWLKQRVDGVIDYGRKK